MNQRLGVATGSSLEQRSVVVVRSVCRDLATERNFFDQGPLELGGLGFRRRRFGGAFFHGRETSPWSLDSLGAGKARQRNRTSQNSRTLRTNRPSALPGAILRRRPISTFRSSA